MGCPQMPHGRIWKTLKSVIIPRWYQLHRHRWRPEMMDVSCHTFSLSDTDTQTHTHTHTHTHTLLQGDPSWLIHLLLILCAPPWTELGWERVFLVGVYPPRPRAFHVWSTLCVSVSGSQDTLPKGRVCAACAVEDVLCVLCYLSVCGLCSEGCVVCVV